MNLLYFQQQIFDALADICFNCRELGHTAVSCPKLRHDKGKIKGTRGWGFVARSVHNYNRRKWYGGTSVLGQTNAFQEKMYTNLGNKGDSSQDREGVGAANNPNGNVWASVQDHVKKCGDSVLPKWVEKLRGQIEEREGAKEGLRDDKNVESGEGEGELSSVAGEEIVEVIP